jgi:hypothetical protein
MGLSATFAVSRSKGGRDCRLAVEIVDSDYATVVGTDDGAPVFELVLGRPYAGERGRTGDPRAWCAAAGTSFDAEQLDAAFAEDSPYAEDAVFVAFRALGVPTDLLQSI